MPVAIDQLQLVYVSVPKCACSSLKLFFHHTATGQSWGEEKEKKGSDTTIHEMYPSEPYEVIDWAAYEGYERIAVVRGPVDRLLSCYADKVIKLKRLESEKAKAVLAKHDLPSEPSFDDFIAHLETYQDASEDIKRHSAPLSYWLGRQPDVYDAVFNVRDLKFLVSWVEAKGAAVPKLRRTNKSKDRLQVREISPATRKKVRAIYEEDIDLFGPWLGKGRKTTRSIDGQVN